MIAWIFKGLRTGVVTNRYPFVPVGHHMRTVPHVDVATLEPGDCFRLATTCPTGAFTCRETEDGPLLTLSYGKCISCGLCAETLPGTVSMSSEFELATRTLGDLQTVYHFQDHAHGR